MSDIGPTKIKTNLFDSFFYVHSPTMATPDNSLDYVAYYENNDLPMPRVPPPLPLLPPPFTFMGGPHKSWQSPAELVKDVVVKEDNDGVCDFTYWPTAQRTTEWMWLTGKTTTDDGLFAGTPPILLTASQVPAIMGLDPNNTRKKIHTMKTAPKTVRAESEMTQMILNWGTDHEPVARHDFIRILKNYPEEETRPLRYLYECGTFQHGKHNWLGASPDGFFTEYPIISWTEAINNMTCALEIKCPWKQTLPDVVPPHHMVQMQVSPHTP